jgi:SagB-type dehydrogenase family enzyme
MSLQNVIKLPEPRTRGDVSIEEALRRRRSTRNFSGKPLTLEEVSQLLWAAQGLTSAAGERTAPSAGATFPLEVHLVVGDVDGLSAGVYTYGYQKHELRKVVDGDRRSALAAAALDQECVKECAANLILTSVYGRTTVEYGERGVRYVHMEAGHVGQNIHLQAAALGLGTLVVGAFDDEAVVRVLDITKKEFPLYIMPLGRLL